MPIYEFSCDSCGKDFEELVLSRSEQVRCPHCDGTELTQAMSTFSFASGGSYSSSQGSGCSGCSKGSCSGCSSH